VAGRGGNDGWAVGDVVNVRLTVTTDEELHYVIVEDMLPAGFEPLNERLETETTRVPRQPGRWYWWGYERKELRDEKVTFFDSYMPPGKHVFDYAVRVVTPGVFSARPAEVYTMYRPEVWGRSASDRVSVAAERLVKRPPLKSDYDRDCRVTSFDTSLVADEWAEGVVPGAESLAVVPGADALGDGASSGAQGRSAEATRVARNGGIRGVGQGDSPLNPTAARDANGDGRLDVTDIATTNGRRGLQCGDNAPLPPGPAGSMALRLDAPSDIDQDHEFTIDVVVEGTGNIGGYELTLDVPAGTFEVIGVEAAEGLPGALTLGPLVGDGSLRFGGYVTDGTVISGHAVLARLTLRALSGEAAEIAVTEAIVVTDRGGQYEVTADGTVVSPQPWAPRAELYVPMAMKQ
jgi:hypothetical protein